MQKMGGNQVRPGGLPGVGPNPQNPQMGFPRGGMVQMNRGMPRGGPMNRGMPMPVGRPPMGNPMGQPLNQPPIQMNPVQMAN